MLYPCLGNSGSVDQGVTVTPESSNSLNPVNCTGQRAWPENTQWFKAQHALSWYSDADTVALPASTKLAGTGNLPMACVFWSIAWVYLEDWCPNFFGALAHYHPSSLFPPFPIPPWLQTVKMAATPTARVGLLVTSSCWKHRLTPGIGSILETI